MLVMGLLFGYAAGVAAGIYLRPWIRSPALSSPWLQPAVAVATLNPTLESIASGRFLGCLAAPLLDTRLGNGLVALKIERPIWHYRAGVARRYAVRSSLATSRFIEQLDKTVNGVPVGERWA